MCTVHQHWAPQSANQNCIGSIKDSTGTKECTSPIKDCISSTEHCIGLSRVGAWTIPQSTAEMCFSKFLMHKALTICVKAH